MKYRRLKTLESTGTPILRYYKLAAGQFAVANAFYGLKDGEATRIEGAVGEDATLIGFSHGGDNLARGLIFLDINDFVVYMAMLEDGEEDRPKIGEIVNGYQKVIDTHYEDESANGKNDDKFGVEYLDVPYYLFVVVQPDGTAYASEISDADAGEDSGRGTGHRDPAAIWEGQATIGIVNGDAVIKYTLTGGSEETVTVKKGKYFVTAAVEAPAALSTVYDAIAVYKDDGTTEVADLVDLVVPVEGLYTTVDMLREVTP